MKKSTKRYVLSEDSEDDAEEDFDDLFPPVGSLQLNKKRRVTRMSSESEVDVFQGSQGGYEGGFFDLSTEADYHLYSSDNEVQVVAQKQKAPAPTAEPKRKRGRPKKNSVPVLEPEPEQQEYCATVYIVLLWSEEKAGKKRGTVEHIAHQGKPIGPTTITTLDPSDIEGLRLLVATTIAAPVEAVDVASFMYKFFKNGRTVGSALPLKDDNGLNHFRTHIKSVNIASKAGEMIHFELHLARPAVKKVQYSVDDDSILGMRVEPINDLSKLIHGKKTLDEKLEPLRIHMFQLYNPGGKFHCGDAKHTEACARDDSSGRHFILGKNQQDTLVFSVLHEGNQWGTLPIGKSAFRPDKSRDFHQPTQPAAGPSTSVAPSTPNNDLLMQMLLQQQQSAQAAQQQQQFMMQTLMSVMGAQRSPFPGAFGGFPQTAPFANTQNTSAPMTPFANPHNGAGQMLPFMNSAPSSSSFPASPFSNTPYPDTDASGAGGPPAM
ncbi:hypothetical protein R3P38DRAFT_3487168 [Favolaschia claudopus]|uniref:Uncharacterized protein n=1 Tax=Favolaschia claudopus TaxID=2862362 RepID=A0AAV9Z692_9AGAR